MRRLLLLLLLAACTKEAPVTTEAVKPVTPAAPAVERARELVASSAELSEFQFTNAAWTTPVAAASMSAPVRTESRDLAKAGWIALDANGDVALNARSRGDKRFLMRPNGLLDVVPLAKKKMGEVTSVRKNDDGTVSVDFHWTWVPNEVGQAFRDGAVRDRLTAPHESRATLIWDGTAWIVLGIQ
jgi:hypothetical protein